MDKDEMYEIAKKTVINRIADYSTDAQLVIMWGFIFRILKNQPDKLLWFLEQASHFDNLS